MNHPNKIPHLNGETLTVSNSLKLHQGDSMIVGLDFCDYPRCLFKTLFQKILLAVFHGDETHGIRLPNGEKWWIKIPWDPTIRNIHPSKLGVQVWPVFMVFFRYGTFSSQQNRLGDGFSLIFPDFCWAPKI